MCEARATYITPLSAANHGERDWIASRRLGIGTHRLVSVVMKEGWDHLARGCIAPINAT